MANTTGPSGDSSAPLPLSLPPNWYSHFVQQIDAIAKSTAALTTLIPAEFAKQTGALLDVYKNAGQPSRPKPGPLYKSDYGYSTSPRDNATLRAQLAARQRGMDPNEAFTEGEGGVRSGAHWIDRINLGGLGQVLPLPRYPGAEPNARDLLQYLGSAAANAAAKRNPQLAQNATKQLYDKWRSSNSVLFDGDNPIGPLTQDQQAQLEQAQLAGGRFASLSDFFTQAENAYAQSRYIKGIFSKVARPFTNLTNLGFQSGATNGPAGPLGFRFPWDNSAFGQGVAQQWARTAFMFNNNVSPGQADDIFSQLMTRGWFGGQQTNDMRKGMAELYNQGYGYVAQQPATYDMLDKATRQGTASISQFIDTMKQVQGAMGSAHLGIQQILSDADALGQLNKQMGGTYMGGVQSALEWNNITGQPSSIMASLLQNPLVQGQMFMRTGLMPWEQGLASTGQRMSGIMGALGVLNGSILTGKGTRSQIGNSGFYNTASGQQEKNALMAHILGVSPEEVNTMLKNRQGWMIGANITDEANAYSTAVQKAIQSGNPAAANIYGGVGKGTWGQLKGDLHSAVDSQGHRIFSDKQIRAIENVDLGAGQGHWQTVYPGRGGGVGKRRWIAGKSAADRAWDRAWMIKNDLAQHTGNSTSNGPQLTVELGPAAKKVMHISTNLNAQQKAAQNAGSVSIDMNTWASGPTSTPFPNLSTAGGGSPDYGSTYDTSNW